jgi:hypothetical protein
MRKALLTALLAGALTAALAGPALAGQNFDASGGRAGDTITVTTGSGDVFESFVLADLPQRGKFQKLVPTADGLTTDFGPGDAGYLGGRWWIDINGNNVIDEGDLTFLCPLLGPAL